MKFVIYSDGSASNNQKADKRIGGYATLVFMKTKEGSIAKKEESGQLPGLTNNQAELTGAIKGLEIVKEALKGNKPESIKLITDSKYVSNGANEYLSNWKKNNWKTSSKSPVKNKELWIQLDSLVDDLGPVPFEYASESENQYILQVDTMAKACSGAKH